MHILQQNNIQAYPPAKYFWQYENGTRTKSGQYLKYPSAIRYNVHSFTIYSPEMFKGGGALGANCNKRN